MPPDVELAPPPLTLCGGVAGAWMPPWLPDDLLFDDLLAPLDVLPLDELLALLDECEVDELPLFTAAWLDPGRMATTAPATATLAKPTVTVVAFSRRRPSSRSATAIASRRALSRAACPCHLVT